MFGDFFSFLYFVLWGILPSAPNRVFKVQASNTKKKSTISSLQRVCYFLNKGSEIFRTRKSLNFVALSFMGCTWKSGAKKQRLTSSKILKHFRKRLIGLFLNVIKNYLVALIGLRNLKIVFHQSMKIMSAMNLYLDVKAY